MPMPSVIEKVNGMIMIVSAAARRCRVGEVDSGELAAGVALGGLLGLGQRRHHQEADDDQCRSRRLGGTMPMIGAKNMNGKKSAPQTTATQPVRPPTLTPDADSM